MRKLPPMGADARCKPTYEGLKVLRGCSPVPPGPRCKPTYEGLKVGHSVEKSTYLAVRECASLQPFQSLIGRLATTGGSESGVARLLWLHRRGLQAYL